MNGQIAFLDCHVRPHVVHDLVLGDKFARSMEEEVQEIGGARS
jgi:hypothetical protein